MRVSVCTRTVCLRLCLVVAIVDLFRCAFKFRRKRSRLSEIVDRKFCTKPKMICMIKCLFPKQIVPEFGVEQ